MKKVLISGKQLLTMVVALAFTLLLLPPTKAQESQIPDNPEIKPAANTMPSNKAAEPQETIPMPVYTNYRGVAIGMNQDEARSHLGKPKDKSESHDYYVFSDTESAQIFYGPKGLVRAISVLYLDDENAPAPNEVFGEEALPKANGSVYRMMRYPQAGYWVAYNRTAGKQPITTITMQQIPERP